jgi:hypothetical protein
VSLVPENDIVANFSPDFAAENGKSATYCLESATRLYFILYDHLRSRDITSSLTTKS